MLKKWIFFKNLYFQKWTFSKNLYFKVNISEKWRFWNSGYFEKVEILEK